MRNGDRHQHFHTWHRAAGMIVTHLSNIELILLVTRITIRYKWRLLHQFTEKKSNLGRQVPTYLMSELIRTGRNLHKHIFLEGHYFISQLASPFTHSVPLDGRQHRVSHYSNSPWVGVSWALLHFVAVNGRILLAIRKAGAENDFLRFAEFLSHLQNTLFTSVIINKPTRSG